MPTSLRRQTIALVTAYAVALQALLPALALAAGAFGDQPGPFVEICTNAPESNGDLPSRHHNGCPHGLACVMTGCWSGAAAALWPEHVPFVPDVSRPAVLTLRSAETASSYIWLPHSARAPPYA